MNHSFSVQMTNTKSVSGIAVNRKKDGVFLEGELGLMLYVELIEDKVLTITGENGTLRIDISRDELVHALNPNQKT